MTTRCEDLIKTLALETSCEGTSLICRHMGLNISGDTIIRMLKKMVDTIIPKKCSDTIGVDDFAYRKGHIPISANLSKESIRDAQNESVVVVRTRRFVTQ